MLICCLSYIFINLSVYSLSCLFVNQFLCMFLYIFVYCYFVLHLIFRISLFLLFVSVYVLVYFYACLCIDLFICTPVCFMMLQEPSLDVWSLF